MITLIVLVVGAMFTLAACGILLETHIWHGGICRECGSSWVNFDTDSQGRRGYMCNCGSACWISYPWIDRGVRS